MITPINTLCLSQDQIHSVEESPSAHMSQTNELMAEHTLFISSALHTLFTGQMFELIFPTVHLKHAEVPKAMTEGSKRLW